MKLESIIEEYDRRMKQMPARISHKRAYLDKIKHCIREREKRYSEQMFKILNRINLDAAIEYGNLFCFYNNKPGFEVILNEIEKSVNFSQLYKTLTNKDVFIAFSEYAFSSHLKHITEYFFRHRSSVFSSRFARDMMDERIKEVLQSYDLHNLEIQSGLINAVSLGYGLKTLDIYEKYPDEEKSEVSNLMYRSSLKAVNNKIPDSQYRDILKVLDKYIGIKEIFKLLDESILYEKTFDCDELLRDDTYERIKKNPSDLNKIENVVYTNIRIMLKDLKDARWEVLDNVARAYRIVMGIHEERSGKHKESIAMNFYQELNRAIKQGTNEKEKEMNLKRYCSEVCEKMRASAEELMYVE